MMLLLLLPSILPLIATADPAVVRDINPDKTIHINLSAVRNAIESIPNVKWRARRARPNSHAVAAQIPPIMRVNEATAAVS